MKDSVLLYSTGETNARNPNHYPLQWEINAASKLAKAKETATVSNSLFQAVFAVLDLRFLIHTLHCRVDLMKRLFQDGQQQKRTDENAHCPNIVEH